MWLDDRWCMSLVSVIGNKKKVLLKVMNIMSG